VIGRNDDEALLDRFRRWLRDARAEADATPADDEPTGGEGRDVGLYTLVEEFTALRHELKLQTKGARGLQDQAEAMLAALRQAAEQFRAVEPKEAQAAFAAARPLAEALADLDEALDRGRMAIDQARRRAAEEALPDPVGALDDLFARRPWPARLLLRRYHYRARALLQAQGRALNPGLLDSLAEGYGLIQGRLRRSLAAEGIEPIPCVGRPVDPEVMAVVGVVDDPGRPPGSVVEEVRRGYTWKGRLLRLAEVRAVRTPAPQAGTELSTDAV
jgi:molecular chaperone GrpE